MTYTVSDGRKRADHAFFTITIEEDSPDGLTSRYRGRGDQVFVLNPEGEDLDEALYTLELGDATTGMYVIATNTADHTGAAVVQQCAELVDAGRRRDVAALLAGYLLAVVRWKR